MTPRPRMKNLDVRLAAAAAALDEIVAWLDKEYQEHQLIVLVEQLVEAFATSNDGYEICRWLDREHNWHPDAELVEILDGQFLFEAEHNAVREWVKHNKPKPTYKDGDVISFNSYGSTWTCGTIVGIHEDVASYSVKIDRNNREPTYWSVPYEDAQLIPVVPEDAVSEE